MSYSGYMNPAAMSYGGGSYASAVASAFVGGNGQVQQNYSGYMPGPSAGYGNSAYGGGQGGYGYPTVTNHPADFLGYTQAPPNNYIDNYYHYGITQVPYNFQRNDYFQQYYQPVYSYQQNQYQLPNSQLPGIYNTYPGNSYGSNYGSSYANAGAGYGSNQGGYGSSANMLQQLLSGYTG